MAVSEKRKKYLREWYRKNNERLKKARRDWAREWRKNNPEKAKEQDKKQHEKYKDHRNKYTREYYRIHKNDAKFKKRRSKGSLRYYYRNKEKVFAQSQANKAIKSGKIEKKIYCEYCGQKTALEKHHFDYKKPYKIIWLCVKHHKELHKKYK